jgi:trehalose 6-phosphate phosphatase
MRPLLSPENVDVLAQFACSRVLLAFDFDGTLAPIVHDRDGATMRTETADSFESLCKLYPCAVISGRSKDDVSSRLGAAAVKYVIGNHGLEPGGTTTASTSRTRPTRFRCTIGDPGGRAAHVRRSRKR